MPKIHHSVSLSEKEIETLKAMTHKGKGESARTVMHANILLLSNDNLRDRKKTNREIAELFSISANTVNEVRKTYANSGLDTALQRKTRVSPAIASKITGDFEAKVISTALGPAPEGRARWTLRLLAEHCKVCKHTYGIQVYNLNITQYNRRDA